MESRKRKPSDSDSDECIITTPKKKKVVKHACTFRKEYSETWSCLTPGSKGESFAFCEICICEFSVKSGGKDDCRRHIESQKHISNIALVNKKTKPQKISSFFAPKESKGVSSRELDVTKSEVMLVELAVSLNLPLSSLDTFTKAVKLMFPDSEVAKMFQCGRSKGTAIAKELSAMTIIKLGSRLKQQVFTVSTDGSNDAGNTKLFPLVVRTSDPDTFEVRSDLLAVPVCERSATGEKIFGLIANELNVHNILWENCIALGSDNANVMVGKKEGVYGHMLRANPEIISASCVCHLIHIGAEKGAMHLSLNVEQLLIDTYYYLDKSSKRQDAFKNMQLLHDLKQSKILKHVSTRWLSITRCLQRIIDNWDALFDFFKAEERKAAGSAEKERTKKVMVLYQSPTNKLYCLFLVEILKQFDAVNTELQCEEPKVHVMQSRLQRLLRNLSNCFLRPAVVARGVLQLDYTKLQPYEFKPEREIIIGDSATTFMLDSKSKLREERVKQFLREVKEFFLGSCKYLRKSLPLESEVLRHATVADPAKQQDCQFSSLRYFIKKFPKMLPVNATMTDLQMEFALYQSSDISACLEDRVDLTWGKISQMKEDNGEKMFKILPAVMSAILTIPHSSAHCERIFFSCKKESDRL